MRSSRLTSQMYIIRADAMERPRDLQIASNLSFTSSSILMDNVVCTMSINLDAKLYYFMLSLAILENGKLSF